MNAIQNAETMQKFVDWATRQPDTDCRRWSYEIECSTIGTYASELQDAGFTTHYDASVDSDGCECSCDICDHKCNCPNCDTDEDSHCDECQHTEAAPKDYDPVLTTHDTKRLDTVRNTLGDAYCGSDTGNHIHVNASDLTAPQVANTLRIWRAIEPKIIELIGRETTSYASHISDSNIRDTASGQISERYLAVNAQGILHHLAGIRAKTTIEFRQFAGTTNADLIVARGFLCRAIVEHVAKNRPLYWLLNAQSASQVLNELGFRI